MFLDLKSATVTKGMKLGVLQYSTIAGWFNHVIAATLSQLIHWVEYYPTWTALLLLQKHGITTSDNEKHSFCSAGNQQQCFSLLPNQHQSSATSHSQPNGANIISWYGAISMGDWKTKKIKSIVTSSHIYGKHTIFFKF